MEDIRDFWEQLAVAMALFVFLLQDRFILKKTRFLLVAVTELLPMYQSPNVCICPLCINRDFHRKRGTSCNAVTKL